MTVLTKDCMLCGSHHIATVSESSLNRHNNGAHAQDAFPYLPDDVRELFFISGICGACWDAMFEDE